MIFTNYYDSQSSLSCKNQGSDIFGLEVASSYALLMHHFLESHYRLGLASTDGKM